MNSKQVLKAMREDGAVMHMMWGVSGEKEFWLESADKPHVQLSRAVGQRVAMVEDIKEGDDALIKTCAPQTYISGKQQNGAH
jgi:hypothetical protein